jgi:hypothetical protein
MKIVSSKVVYPLKIYQKAKYHDPTLSGESFRFTLEVWTIESMG